MDRDINHTQIKIYSSFVELAETPFSGISNAYCWQRNLDGDFKEIVENLQLHENITEISVENLESLSLTHNGNIARQTILNDIKLLTNFGASPSLNLLNYYDRDTEFDFISTDVYSFHVDRSPVPTDTFLCTYFGAASEMVPNQEAQQKILVPEIREKLWNLYNGKEEGFEDFLTEYFFDLHYEPQPNAHIISLGIGNLWKLAVDHPTQKVFPCIHRAPKENENELRLLLIC